MFFGTVIKAGERASTEADMDLHISMAAVEPSSSSKPVSLFVSHEDEDNDGKKVQKEYLVCSLNPSCLTQVALDLSFMEGETFSFHIKGDGKVYLTGYYIPNLDDMDPDFGEESGSEAEESEEEEEVSEEDSPAKPAKKEPVAVKGSLSAKRPNQSNDEPASKKSKGDAAQTNGKKPQAVEDSEEEDDDDDDELDSADEEDLSKLLAGIKKAKETNGKTAAADDEEEQDEDDMDDEEEDDEDEEEMEQDQPKPKGNLKQDDKKPVQQQQKGGQNFQRQGQKFQGNKFQGNRGGQHNQGNRGFGNKSPNNSFNKGNKPGTPFNKGGNQNNQELSVKDVVEGKGPSAVSGKMVTVSYVGKIGNKVFDQSKNFSFRLGRGEVIKGWDIGVKDMKVGGKRILDIPPELGYGKQRTGPIPPNSQLHFEVELKRVA